MSVIRTQYPPDPWEFRCELPQASDHPAGSDDRRVRARRWRGLEVRRLSLARALTARRSPVGSRAVNAVTDANEVPG